MEARQAVLVGFLLFVVVYEALGQVDLHDVPVINQPPKKVIRYKLIRMSDEDIKKEQDAKRVQQLNDAKHAFWHKKLFPCEDYSPLCGRYKNIWNPGVAQCRDVFMQRNCRETCGLCNVPFGVFLGCNDMHHCKALGSNACVHKWVEETCKTMCGSCDGSKGRGTARVGASSVFVGKKKSIVHKETGEKKEQKVKTVHEAVENQNAAIETEENPHAQETVEENPHAQETVEDVEDHEEDENEDEMENQSGYNMENMESASGEPADQSGESAEAETPAPKSKVEKPKVEVKQEVTAPVVQDAPKKVVEAKKPVHHKTHKVHHHHHHHKHHHHHHKKAYHHTKKVQHDKKPKKVVNPVKVLVNKHKKTTKS